MDGRTRPSQSLMAGIFPRLSLLIVWVARPSMVDAAFASWIWPC